MCFEKTHLREEELWKQHRNIVPDSNNSKTSSHSTANVRTVEKKQKYFQMSSIKPITARPVARKSILRNVPWMVGYKDIFQFIWREGMMTKKIGVFLVVLLGLTAAAAIGGQNKGAKEILIHGGNHGDVLFPHNVHQGVLKDCGACHSLFPQDKNAIQTLQTKGELKKKQVMTQCRNCHKEKKKAGLKTGPTSCKKCHSG